MGTVHMPQYTIVSAVYAYTYILCTWLVDEAIAAASSAQGKMLMYDGRQYTKPGDVYVVMCVYSYVYVRVCMY